MEYSLKELVKQSEERFIWFKKELSSLYSQRDVFDPDDEFTIWYKSYLREQKTINESWMKSLVEERDFLRNGLSSPYLYKTK